MIQHNLSTPSNSAPRAASAPPSPQLPRCKAPLGKDIPPGNCSWYDPGNPDPTHQQAYTYDKANETIELLFNYTQAKIIMLKEAADGDQKDTVYGTLGSFCDRQHESAEECVDRYERYSLLEMARMRASIIQNDTSTTSLMSRRVSYTGAHAEGVEIPTVLPVSPDTASGQHSIVSYFPSFAELKARYDAKSARLRASISNTSATSEFSQWLNDLSQGPGASPRKEDFPKFKRIRRDPDNPAAGYFTVVDLDASGKPKTDEAAYLAAISAYDSAKKKNHSMKDDVAKLRTAISDRLQHKGELIPARLEKSSEDLSFKAFGIARGSLVDVSNASTATMSGRTPSSRGQTKSMDGKRLYDHEVKKATDPQIEQGANEAIIQPTPVAGVDTTSSVRLPVHEIRDDISRRMRMDVGDTPPPQAVELPPTDESPY